jgi:hypothetical protein
MTRRPGAIRYARTAKAVAPAFTRPIRCLNPDLPVMVKHAVSLGLSTYATTDGLLLKKIGRPCEAGLRTLTVGFYGANCDRYVQRDGRYRPAKFISAATTSLPVNVELQGGCAF